MVLFLKYTICVYIQVLQMVPTGCSPQITSPIRWCTLVLTSLEFLTLTLPGSWLALVR